MDRLMDGKIDRRVLQMTKTMLLSRNETMNGSGYPFGLSKQNIPLAGRIYTIIRAYEALCAMQLPKQAIHTMNEWVQGGYFDQALYQVFVSSLDVDYGLPGFQTLPNTPFIHPTQHRIELYTEVIHTWHHMLDLIDKIKSLYHDSREAMPDSQIQNSVLMQANKLQLELLRVANLRKIILVTRH